MIKIAISGKLGCGKDLFLHYAQANYPHLRFENRKFAGPIYKASHEIQKMLGIPAQKDGKLLQFIGNHYREHDPDFWIRRFFREPLSQNVIVTDIRYPDELAACKVNGFTIIRIVRNEELRLENIGNRDSHHISETALDNLPSYNYDYTINNNSDLEFFENAVIHIVDEVIRGQQK